MAIYFDNNATTALDAEVLEEMLPYMGQIAGNPSSVHRFGRLQKTAIEKAREQVAQLLGAQASQVIFTSGGTEANNFLLNGFCRAISTKDKRMSISAVEHPSVLEPAQQLPLKVDEIAVDSDGKVTMAHLEQALHKNTVLVSVMLANNETGVIQDLVPLVERVKSQGAYFHSDVTQAAGKIALNFSQLKLDAISLSAHKIYGPLGIGALVVDKQLPLATMQLGGSQEHKLRAGTENIPAIVGFGKAAELAQSQLEARTSHSLKLKNALEAGLAPLKEVSIFAQTAQRLPNTVQFGVAGFDGETLLMNLDKKAIAVSSGSACTSAKTENSHVLQAMKIKPALANSAIRVSFGKDNQLSEVADFLNNLKQIIKLHQNSAVMMAATI